MNTLQNIITYKREELAYLRRRVSLEDVQKKASDAKPALNFIKNFGKEKTNLICEIKKASPSAGIICDDFNPVDIAHIYEDGGANAISVLTDEHFFQGSLQFLIDIKKAVKLPCLRKDFTFSEYHIYEARGAGADAILLIAAALDDYQLKDYQALAAELGMKSLMEMHDISEAKRLIPLNCSLVGVNNRNLNTFEINLKVSEEVFPYLGLKATKISESGIKTSKDIKNLREMGYDGFLVGETLMREKNIAEKLKTLKSK